jgi:hypothetical protein
VKNGLERPAIGRRHMCRSAAGRFVDLIRH